jgi:hypothetical protein
MSRQPNDSTVPPQLALSPVEDGLQAEARLSLISALLGPMPSSGEWSAAIGLAYKIAVGLDGDALAGAWREIEKNEEGWYITRAAAAMEER